jgi:hypothetical protein
MTYARSDLLDAAQSIGPTALFVLTRVLLVLDRRRATVAAQVKSDSDEVLKR